MTGKDELTDARDQFNNHMYYARSIIDLVADLHDYGADGNRTSLKGACIAAVEHLDAAMKYEEVLRKEVQS